MFVDPDDPGTWPMEVSDWILARLAAQSGEMSEPLAPADGLTFVALLDAPVRAYHLTRLLPHENEAIRRTGLDVLTEELRDRRISNAFRAGEIAEADAELLSRANRLAEKHQERRLGQVCLLLSTRSFTDRGSGASHFLGRWGGEVVSGSAIGVGLPERLVKLGSPAIVVADIQLDDPFVRTHIYPSAASPFLATAAGLGEGGGASVYREASVPPESIVAIWQPGDRQYDRLGLRTSS